MNSLSLHIYISPACWSENSYYMEFLLYFVRQSSQQFWLEHQDKVEHLLKKLLRLWPPWMRYIVRFFVIGKKKMHLLTKKLTQLSCVWLPAETHYFFSFQPNFTIWMHRRRSLYVEPGNPQHISCHQWHHVCTPVCPFHIVFVLYSIIMIL